MSKNISHAIVDTCKKYGISYQSKNPHYHKFVNDAMILVKLYVNLKEIMAQLLEIEERHSIKGLSELIKNDIEKLETVDHDLIRFAKRIKQEETANVT
jgi:hypothetical protein